MADPQTRTLLRRIAKLEDFQRRLKTPGLGHSTVDGGAIQVQDWDEILRMIIGQQWDGTNTSAIVNGPPPPAPTLPLVTNVIGGVRVYWDGTYADGSVAPMDFTRVTIHAVPTSEFTVQDPLDQTRIVGTLSHATGLEQIVSLPYVEHTVWLVAWSQAGKFSAPSGIALGTPTRVARVDIDDEVDNAIQEGQDALGAIDGLQQAIDDAQADADAALTSANGKNKVYYQPTAPTGGTYAVGDTWFDTDNGHKLHNWSGSAWVAVQFGNDALATAAITAEKIADNVITEQQLNASITDAILAAQQAGDDAQASADGKNTIYYQAAQPSGGILGDTWFDSDDGYKIYRHNGTTWVGVNLGGSAIGPDAITAEEIAAGVITATELSSTINDAIAAAQQAGDDAQASADGKNTIYYQASEPTGGTYAVGDTWFDTDNGHKIHRWSGTAWVASALGTDAIANASITNALIADATIQSAKIAALDAGKITTGTLDAARIAARSITAEKVVLSGTENLIPDSTFATALGVAWETAGLGISIGATAGRDGGRALVVNHTSGTAERITTKPDDAAGGIPLVSGASYRLLSHMKSSVASDGGLILGVRWKNTAGVWTYQNVAVSPALSANVWTTQAGNWTAPADAVAFRPFLLVSSTAANGVYTFDQPSCVRAAGAELIVDGSVSAVKMVAGTITAASGIIGEAAIGSAQIIDASIGSAEIANLAVTNAHIADATIQSAKIAALDAGKITTGTLDANRIGANTITAEKIVLSGTENLIPDPGFASAPGVGWLLPASGSIGATAGRDGGRGLVISHVNGTTDTAYVYSTDSQGIPIVGGGVYRLLAYAKSSVTGVGPILGVRWKNTAGVWTNVTVRTFASMAANTWVAEGEMWTAPADAVMIRPYLRVNDIAPTGTFTFDEPSVVRAASAALIVDGSITASKMVAGTITAASAIIADAAIGSAQIIDASIGNAEIADASITNAKIQDATIQSAKIAALDAGKITTGTLDAARIAAGTITVDKLLVTGTENIIPDPTFTAPLGVTWDTSPTWSIDPTGARDGRRALRCDHITGTTRQVFILPNDSSGGLPVVADGSYRLGAWAKSAAVSDTTAWTWIYRWKNTANVWTTVVINPTMGVTAGGWTWASAIVTMPNDAVAWRPGIRVLSSSATDTYWFSNPSAVRAANSELIVDGSVIADKIAAGAITAVKIAANTITAAQIASGTITAGQIAANTITANEIAADAVTANEILAGTITATQIAAGTITANEIASGTITGDRLVANTITATQIAANTITAGQIAAGTITATELAAGSITGDRINATFTITGKTITGGTIIGTTFQTASSGVRLVINDDEEAGSIKGHTGDGAATAPTRINPRIIGTGTTRRQSIYISSGGLGGGIGSIDVLSGSVDDTIPARVILDGVTIVKRLAEFEANAKVLGTNDFIIDRYVGGGGTTATINNSGAIIRTGSRREMKDEIAPLTLEEARLALGMESVTFKWRPEYEMGDRRQSGFIAQQVRDAGAHLWTTGNQEDPNGVAYAELSAALLVLVKDQQARIEALEARFA